MYKYINSYFIFLKIMFNIKLISIKAAIQYDQA